MQRSQQLWWVLFRLRSLVPVLNSRESQRFVLHIRELSMFLLNSRTSDGKAKLTNRFNAAGAIAVVS
jgi:hypothetical protein